MTFAEYLIRVHSEHPKIAKMECLGCDRLPEKATVHLIGLNITSSNNTRELFGKTQPA